MRFVGPKSLTFLALLAVARFASASYLVCEDKVNGQSSVTVAQFPASLTWELTVTEATCAWCATQPNKDQCMAYCGSSLLKGESNPKLEAFVGAPIAWGFPEGVTGFPFWMWRGESLTTFVPSVLVPLRLGSYADCVARAKAAGYGVGDGGVVEFADLYKVEWFEGGVQPPYAECSTKVICVPPLGPTRTIGYFRTHPLAVQACVESGIDLGYFSIAAGDAAAALGLFGANPARYDDGSKRSPLDQARIILARQLLGAICNARVFGSTPSDPGIIDAAIGALSSGVCTNLSYLTGELDAFNNSGDTGENWFGNATPGVYADPTPRTSASCR